MPRCREKRRKPGYMVLVPETDTGGQVENTKVREITLSKELGKITS